MTGLATAQSESERAWLSDLDRLRREAPFADLSWCADDTEQSLRAHKCVVYARATGLFQQRYIGVPYSISEAQPSLYGHSSTSFRTLTPLSNGHGESITPTLEYPSDSPRPSSSTEYSEPLLPSTAPPLSRSLGSTDFNVFEAAIEFFYTAGKEAKAFATVLDGFHDAVEVDEGSEDAVVKLRQDLLYCWRSKLYADVTLILEGSDSTPFAAHRAILASRSPYFRSLLLGNFGDSQQTAYTLPAPPFTAASTTFVLGYIYAGTLDFSSRKFDLSTAFEIWRCAAFLAMTALQAEVEEKIIDMLSVARAARILSFAHAVDVSNARLARSTLPLVIDHFENVWAGPPIGHLPYEVQKQLVRQVCSAVQPATFVKTAKKVNALRKRIEADRAVWADHVRSMVDAIEEELVAVLASRLPETIASSGFVDLIDGVGFSTDVLEWLLTLIVKGLTESKAAESYQVLVGSVLLREEGILADARILVEDAKNGILQYIKRKWISVRAAGGFDNLDSWCLRELADELDVTAEELTADGPRLRSSPARARHPPNRLVGKAPVLSQRLAGQLLPAEAAGTHIATSSPRESRVRSSSRREAGSAPRTASSTTATTISRVAANSGRTVRAHDSRPSPSSRLSTTLSEAQGRRPPVTSLATSASAPVTSASSRHSTRTTSNSRQRTVSSSSSIFPAAPFSTPQAQRRGTSPTPSTASRSSASSRPSPRVRSVTRTINGQKYPAQAATAQANAIELRPSTSRPAQLPNVPAVSRGPRAPSSSNPVTSKQTHLNRPPLRPASQSSLARQRSPSAASPAKILNSSSGAAESADPPLPTSSSRRSLRASTSGRARPPPIPTTGKTGPPGTTLLTGIPCIATVRTSRAMRIKAMVRYIGQLAGDEGQWVGVEALESAIPAEAHDLAWNDGTKDGIVYFKLTPSVSAKRPLKADVPRSADARVPARNASSSDTSALRPPSRRARRSTSTEPSGSSGPRKGLFVRPDQVWEFIRLLRAYDD
ncbi:hypothetical protein JCM11251_000008 [Rhodosporidiobolus azoricus]